MSSKLRVPIAIAVAAALALTATPSPAVLPALLAKQVIQQVLQRELRQHLAAAFTHSGCNAPPQLAAFASSAGALPGAASPALAGNALSAVSGALPGKVGMVGSLGSLGIAHVKQLFAARHAPSLPAVTPTAAANAPTMETAAGVQSVPAGVGDDAAAVGSMESGAAVGHLPAPNAMQALVGGVGTGGFGGSQMAATNPQMLSAMAAINAAAAHPLSYEESKKVFDDLVTLRLLDPQHVGELLQCSTAAGPQGVRALGQTAAIFRSTVLPPLTDAKARFANLTPPEQTELATQITEELERAPEKERQEFLDGFGTGLFPEPVLQQVHARLGR